MPGARGADHTMQREVALKSRFLVHLLQSLPSIYEGRPRFSYVHCDDGKLEL